MRGLGNIKSTLNKTLTGTKTVNGLGVVAELGKPYIKLEFEDNEALVDFQKRIQPSGEAEPVEFRDGEFYPIEGVEFTQKDFFDILENNKEIYKYKDFTESNVLKDFGEPKQIADSKGNIKYAFVVNTPLKGSESKIYIWADLNHALFDNSTKEDRSRYWTMIKPTLERPGIVFEKGKENYFIKCFETSNGVKIYFTFIPCLINEKRLKTFYVRTNRERKKRDLFEKYKDGGLLKYWEDVTAINGADRPEDRILFVECRLYASKDDNNFSDRQIFNKNLEVLGAAGDLYLVRDLRMRARKEPGDVVSNKNLRFYKIEGEEVSNFNKDIYEKDRYFDRKIDGYRNIYITKKDGNYYTQFTFFEPRKKENYNEPTLAGYWRNIDTLVNINKVLNYQATPYRTDDNLQLLEDRGRADGVIHRNTKNITTFYGWITAAYNKELRQNAFNEFYNERQTVEDKYYSKYQKKLLTDFYTNPKSYKIRLIDSYSGGKTSSAIGDSERDEFIGLLKNSGLGAPGDVYLVTDTRNNPRKDLSKMSTFQKFDTRKLNVENLQKMSEDDPLLYEEIKSGLGMFLPDESLDGLTVNDQPAAVFNCPEAFLQTKGFTPTYTRLEDYSFLIEPATGEKRLVGYGFEAATLDQLKNACKNYKQVAKLAAHLKGDTELQSAFNVWHWLHTNIKYNYDAPGEEEIRTPARTFADRESGVDCDCLAVFAACLLGAMGYKPRFEIVAFGNSPKFSHIYVNLNGAAVDRVLPVFLARPSGITKTKIMEIPVFELSGGSAMEAAATLNGIYETALAKVQAHEATAEDSADLRKSQILMTLQNSDPQAYRLAAILMPYVVAIDDDGAWYFADAKVAEIADKADKKLYELKISEVNENIFNDFFNDIVNEFKNISVKVERGDGKTVLTISFNNPAGDVQTITGDYVKKDFIALNPNFLTMRESLKNLLAVNYLGLASKYAVGLMTEQEAVAAGYSVETWKKAVKAFETLTRFWILIGGKAENIADIILNGSAKEPLTDKNINYEANIVATSDTDAILSGCKKRGLSGLNGLGETPTVASDIENLGEEGLEKILDWCSDIETEEEKAAENSDENPVNVLAENATPAAAASSAPAANSEKKKSLLWWLLGGAALGGGIAAATGGKKNKRRK